MDPVRTASRPPLPPELLLSLGAMFGAHLADLLRFARCLGIRREDAEDIAQQTFLALVEAMAAGRYDPSMPALPSAGR